MPIPTIKPFWQTRDGELVRLYRGNAADVLALLRGVLERPDDDAPRLVYADWLEENAGTVPCPDAADHGRHRKCNRCGSVYVHVHKYSGCDEPACEGCESHPVMCPTCDGSGTAPDGSRERAEFIRVQCELARTWEAPESTFGTAGGGKRLGGLRRRERELWGQLNTAFDIGPPLPASLRPGRPRLESRLPDDPRIENEHNILVVRRGFADEVRLTLGAFVGGPCECGLCSGTGRRLPGVARGLFERHPVTTVRLVDRNPVELPGRSGVVERGWHWPVGDGRNAIPWYLYNIMPDNPFPSEAAAVAALSAACVTWGRGLAGLGPR